MRSPGPALSVLLIAALQAAGDPSPTPAVKPPSPLARPVEQRGWVLPAQGKPALPIWGIKDGIAVGLWPAPGPRGLIRVYAPYLGQPLGRPINFIAVEPIVGRRRGFSELEPSKLDGAAGLRMWTAQSAPKVPRPELPWQPARPKFFRIGQAEAMSFILCVEPFGNAARPIVQIVLRNDRPHEVAFRVFSAEGGAEMTACCLTATMGNYARLRRLWLKGQMVDARQLWPDFKPTGPRGGGFAPRRRWGIDRMVVVEGQAVVAATPDEADPARATYDRAVGRGWRYQGRPAVQYWIAKTRKDLAVSVNGRRTYWNSQAPIPAGFSFENFELLAPFESGQEFRFGVTPRPSEFKGVDKQWLESTRPPPR